MLSHCHAAFAEMHNQMAELLVSSEGAEKSKRMVAAVVALDAALQADPSLGSCELLSSSLDACDRTLGAKVEEASLKILDTSFDMFLVRLLEQIDDNLSPPWNSLLEICRSLLSWHPKDEVKQSKVRKLVNVRKLGIKLKRFSEMGSDIVKRVTHQESTEVLGEILRTLLALDLNVKEIDWGNTEAAAVQELAKASLQEAQAAKGKLVEERLTEAPSKAGQLAGGMRDGSRWDQGLGRSAGWEAVLAKSRSTLLAREKEEILTMYSVRDELHEAAGPRESKQILEAVREMCPFFFLERLSG